MNLCKLSKDLKYSILILLAPKDLLNMVLCNKRWNQVFQDEKFWQRKILTDYQPYYLRKADQNTYKTLYIFLYQRAMLEYDYKGLFVFLDYIGRNVLDYIDGDFSDPNKTFVDEKVPIEECQMDLDLLNNLKTMSFKRHDIRIANQMDKIKNILKDSDINVDNFCVKGKHVESVRLLFTVDKRIFFTEVENINIERQILNICKEKGWKNVETEIQSMVAKHTVNFKSFVNHRYVVDFISLTNFRGFENLDGKPICRNSINAYGLNSNDCITLGTSDSQADLDLIIVYDLETKHHLFIGQDTYGFIHSFNIEQKYYDDIEGGVAMFNVQDDLPKLLDVAIDTFKKFTWYDD